MNKNNQIKYCRIGKSIAFCAIFVAFLAGCSNNKPMKESKLLNEEKDSIVQTVNEMPEKEEQEGVDLGLSVNWAECNVGASKPQSTGFLVSLGNVRGTTKVPKPIRNDICGTDRDIAKVKMGGKWRMPTALEMKELIDDCKWTSETLKNVNGYRVTGKNGNSIFLPACGGCWMDEKTGDIDFEYKPTDIGTEGSYWCGQPYNDFNILMIYPQKGGYSMMIASPYFCMPVRAVWDK